MDRLFERGFADMLARLTGAFLVSATLAAVVIGSRVLVSSTFAGEGAIVPHKLTIVFTGGDLGKVKPCW